jgi:hypothetical protein
MENTVKYGLVTTIGEERRMNRRKKVVLNKRG